MMVTREEIQKVEKLLLPDGCSFNDEAKTVIECFKNREILACPGSGKTTVLLAKIKLLSDRMPFKEGKGICVLSHTNVAVNEIKNKLDKDAYKILEYPNFVGTIQSFIDHYVVFPYLCGITQASIQVTDDENFAEAFWRKSNLGKNSKIKWLIVNGCKMHKQFESPIDFIKKLRLTDGDLYVEGIKKKKAGKGTDSVKQYNSIIKELLINDGLIRYKDAYSYTEDALNEYGSTLKLLLSERFKFVFVDEYQDCMEQQRKVIDSLFDKSRTVIQKIGDIDQAIYSSDLVKDSKWNIGQDYISLPGTNRYGQEIADVLMKLRTGNKPIVAFKGKMNIAPTVIVFNENSKGEVVDTFIKEIKNNKLDELFPSGPFKAIGMYKNVTGLKIGDYWVGYQSKTGVGNVTFTSYVQEIAIELKNGNLYNAEKIVRKLLCKICYYSGIVSKDINQDGSNKMFTISSVKVALDECKTIDYREKILGLTKLCEYDYETVEKYLVKMIDLIIGKDNVKMPESFWEVPENPVQFENKANAYYGKTGVTIDFETVYKVKGETHIATLYLETEKNRGTDIKRIMPLLEGKKPQSWTDTHEKSRRCVYVGLSRPSHLLCVAIQASTYKQHEKAFEGWKIIPLI